MPCPSGFVSASEGSTSCDPCPLGMFTSGGAFVGNTACQVCSQGFYADKTGSSACSPCAPGYFSTGENLTEHCSPCAYGSFQPGTANSSCITCAHGMTTRAQAQISQSECVCAPDKVLRDGACTPCGPFQSTYGTYAADSCELSDRRIAFSIAGSATVSCSS